MTRTPSADDRIAAVLGRPVVASRSLGGGCIAQVRAVTLDDGTELVVKQGRGLALEGRMLDYLGTRTRLPVPRVMLVEEDLMVMERLPAGGRLNGPAQAHGARLLADLHRIRGDEFGFAWDTVIGGLAQPNPRTTDWLEFFRDHRLLYMARLALNESRLPVRLYSRIETLAGHLDRWIDQPSVPGLIHGDMWTGNVLCEGSRISGFVDPALYFADPEIELAFSTLFGTFGEPFFSAYHEIIPARPGFFEVRRDLYNLYPLLVHVRLFGGSYVGSVEAIVGGLGF